MPKNQPINLEEDATQEPGIPSDSALSRVSELARAAQSTEDAVEALETRLKEEKERLRGILERDLPNAMRQAGLEKITTDLGTEVKLSQAVYASISEANRTAAHTWLREHGHGDLIKNVLSVSFGAGEDDDAQGAVALLQASGLSFGSLEQKQQVHPQTLRVFIREQVEGGKPVPLELFGAHLATVAKIKRKD